MNIKFKINLNPFLFLFGCDDNHNDDEFNLEESNTDEIICGCENKSACLKVLNNGEIFLDTDHDVYAIQLDLNTKKIRTNQVIDILINSDKINGYYGPKAISIISLGETPINKVASDKPICQITNFELDNLKSIKVYDKDANKISVGILI